MKKKTPTISIGIPTYEAGGHLVTVLKSIYDQSRFEVVKSVYVLVDGKEISKEIIKKIENKKLKVIKFSQRAGQSTRINNILKMQNSDLIILTNDDVIWERNALEKVLNKYMQKPTDLIAGKVSALTENSFLGKTLNVGNEIACSIGFCWNHGDNYLMANGRFFCLTKKFAKTIKIPGKLWNNDAFIFLSAKQGNYSFNALNDVSCKFKVPGNIREFLKQSHKFRFSQMENQKYFKNDISKYYKIPIWAQIKVFFHFFISRPGRTLFYRLLNLLAWVTQFNYQKKLGSTPYWETDPSTKQI